MAIPKTEKPLWWALVLFGCCSLFFFRASQAREMNTCLEGEERVLKISPFTLKKWRLQLTNL